MSEKRVVCNLPNKLNKHTDMTCAISHASYNGHVKVLEWIYNNISKNFEYVFDDMDLAFEKKKDNVLRWFENKFSTEYRIWICESSPDKEILNCPCLNIL